ncbi:MAG: TIGR02444 family protein [Xanthobacteraceae bacterium]
MTEPESTALTPFWRFSLNFYRQAGVSDACIALQDGCGVDVNLLLFLVWLASEGRQVSPQEVKTFDDRVRSWRELTIVPIRDTRRKLKGATTLVDPSQQEAFRNKVKAVELDAEQLQQEALYNFTRSGPLGAKADPSAAARANIAAYEKAMGLNFRHGATAALFVAFDRI